MLTIYNNTNNNNNNDDNNNNNNNDNNNNNNNCHSPDSILEPFRNRFSMVPLFLLLGLPCRKVWRGACSINVRATIRKL